MNKTSPSWRSVRSEARSPARASTGPEVTRRPTPSCARRCRPRLAEPRGSGKRGRPAGRAGPPPRARSEGLLDELPLPTNSSRSARRSPALFDLLGDNRRGVDLRRATGSPSTSQTAHAGVMGTRGSAQRSAQQLLDAVFGLLGADPVQGPPDLLGAVAELDQHGDRPPPGHPGPGCSPRSRRPEVGQLQAAPQVDQEPCGGLQTDAGDGAQGIGVLLDEAMVSVAGDSCDRIANASASPTPCAPSRTSKHRRSSAMAEPVQDDGVLTDMGVDVQVHIGTDRTERRHGRRRHRQRVASRPRRRPP